MHDDRLGPYARLGFLGDESGEVEHSWIKLLPAETGFESFETRMRFEDALVPMYPKLRLTAEELVGYAVDLYPTVRFLAVSEELYAEPRFCLAGDYLRSLHGRSIASERVVRICTQLVLSRYVAVVSWHDIDGEWTCDIVYDTTDLRRDERARPPILGIFARDPAWVDQLEQMRNARFGNRPLIA